MNTHNLPQVSLSGDHLVTTSLAISEHFGKSHAHILRSIKNLECSREFNESNFGLGSYIDGNQQDRPKYEITQDGFMFLCMGFTGKQAAIWKEKYINEFNRMAKALKQPAPAIAPNTEIQDFKRQHITLQDKHIALQEELLSLLKQSKTASSYTAEPSFKPLTDQHCKRWDKTQIAQLQQLQKQGYSYTQIASKLGRSYHSIASKLRTTEPQTKHPIQPTRYSQNEINAIITLYQQGWSRERIARQIGRSASGVRNVINKYKAAPLINQGETSCLHN